MAENIIKKLESMFVKELSPIRSTKVLQLLVLRQSHDYAIFRTEETRELNLVTCTLKDKLCQECPRCTLFGSVSTEGGRGERYNFKHRIEYSTAYSLEDYEDISELITFNAVNTDTQSTEQALGFSENVRPLANFPSIMSLISVTQEEFVAYIKTLLSCKSYGAESRIKGDMTNLLLGISAGYEEIITPLEYNLEICGNMAEFKKDPIAFTVKVLEKYKAHAMFPDKVIILNKNEVESLVDEIAKTPFDRKFIEEIYKQSQTLTQQMASSGDKSKGKNKAKKEKEVVATAA
jgi:CRISPR-associated protein Csc2